MTPATRSRPGVRMIENAYVRAAPSAGSAALGVVKRGEALPLEGRTADGRWLKVVHRGVPGWVSARMGVTF